MRGERLDADTARCQNGHPGLWTRRCSPPQAVRTELVHRREPTVPGWNYGDRGLEPFTWSGACVNGKISGEGRLTFTDDGNTYQGGMAGGSPHGRGTFVLAAGDRHEGEFRLRRQARPRDLHLGRRRPLRGRVAQRQGARPRDSLEADGTRYEGEWRDGCFGERDGRWATMGTSAAACGFE